MNDIKGRTTWSDQRNEKNNSFLKRKEKKQMISKLFVRTNVKTLTINYLTKF